MASAYPGALDTLGNMESHADLGNAIEAVQAELGTDPAGASATVKARFAVIQAATSVTGTRGTGDSDILARLLTALATAGIITDNTST
jgi:hypothetical protein